MDQQPQPSPERRKPDDDDLARAARRAIDAMHTSDDEAKRPVVGNIRLIGSMGWSILLPTFAGLWIGHWCDDLAGTGMLFHTVFMVLGLFAGFAWMVVRLDRLARAEIKHLGSRRSDTRKTP